MVNNTVRCDTCGKRVPTEKFIDGGYKYKDKHCKMHYFCSHTCLQKWKRENKIGQMFEDMQKEIDKDERRLEIERIKMEARIQAKVKKEYGMQK